MQTLLAATDTRHFLFCPFLIVDYSLRLIQIPIHTNELFPFPT